MPMTLRLIRASAVLLLILMMTTCRVMRVASDSMRDSLHPGDLIVVDRSAAILGRVWNRAPHPARGQLVVFRVPGEDVQVKRVLAGPGDRVRIEHGALIVNGTPVPEPYALQGRDRAGWPLATTDGARRDVLIAPGHYFCLGDNRGASYDSRHRGAIPEEDLVGIVRFRWRRGS